MRLSSLAARYLVIIDCKKKIIILFLMHFTIVFVHAHLQIFTDRAARREISEVEVLCDYCEWTGKEKYLQVMF